MIDSTSPRKFRKTDAIAIAILFAIALIAAGFFWLRSQNSQDRIAVISVSGTPVKEINLTQNKRTETFTVEGKDGIATFSLEANRIRFIDAQCPDKVCEHTGWVQQPGEAAVCLPFETSLKVYLAEEWSG